MAGQDWQSGAEYLVWFGQCSRLAGELLGNSRENTQAQLAVGILQTDKCLIEKNCLIGRKCQTGKNCLIGRKCLLGKHCLMQYLLCFDSWTEYTNFLQRCTKQTDFAKLQQWLPFIQTVSAKLNPLFIVDCLGLRIDFHG